MFHRRGDQSVRSLNRKKSTMRSFFQQLDEAQDGTTSLNNILRRCFTESS